MDQGLQVAETTSSPYFYFVEGSFPSPDSHQLVSKKLCKDQMIRSHVRMEHKHPQTGEVVLRDTFSFCNHHGFPDEMVVEMAQEVFDELQLLMLPADVSSAMASAEAWPDLIPVVQHKYSDPDIKKIFQKPIGGAKDSCDRCNVSGLLELSQYYNLHDSQDCQSKQSSAVSCDLEVSDKEIPVSPLHSTHAKISNSCHRELSDLFPCSLSTGTPNTGRETSAFNQFSPPEKVPNPGCQSLDLCLHAPNKEIQPYSFRKPISVITKETAGSSREVSTSPSYPSPNETNSDEDSSFSFSEYLNKISFQSRYSYTSKWVDSNLPQSSSSSF